MADILWSLLTGLPCPAADATAARLKTGGYRVMAMRRADGTPAPELVPREPLIAEARRSCLLCPGSDGVLYALWSFESYRDAETPPDARLRGRLAELLGQRDGWLMGVGGCCRFYELIPFSRREALASLRSASASKTVQGILRYVDAGALRPDFNITDAARARFLNYAYLCTAFRRDMGVTVNAYVRMLRIRRALELLEEGLGIGAVAARVGYGDSKYFIKCFHRELGFPPGGYQKRAAHNP